MVGAPPATVRAAVAVYAVFPATSVEEKQAFLPLFEAPVTDLLLPSV